MGKNQYALDLSKSDSIKRKGLYEKYLVKEGNLAKKAVYSLTTVQETEFESGVNMLITDLMKNLEAKENISEIPETGLVVLQQQFLLSKYESYGKFN